MVDRTSTVTVQSLVQTSWFTSGAAVAFDTFPIITGDVTQGQSLTVQDAVTYTVFSSISAQSQVTTLAENTAVASEIDQRVLPSGARADLLKPETGAHELVFLTLDHPEISDPVRVVSDPKNYILDGNEHIGFRFNIALLSDNDRPPEAQLSIQNVDRRIVQLLRRIVDPVELKIEVVWSDQFDETVDPRTEIGVADRMYVAESCFLSNVEIDAMMITGTIRSRDYTQELYPGVMATRERLPGLFR